MSTLKKESTLPSQAFDLEVIKKELHGTTLQVYLLLAKAKDRNFGVREVQRTLDLSSVSLADYHLRKIENLNLITKNSHGKYRATELLPIGEMEEFFVLKGRYLPREIFFLSFTTSTLLFSVIFLILRLWGPMLALLFASAVSSTIYSWIRFSSLWKKKHEEIE
ncbi:MAG: hypothetical protein JSV04_08105 [Candidatus Heimdallarchaeota archaeon]|nr:MAG: hypothetical protein JSV04_08105 [Candidatus Heimdallarchaeota archaeon]